MSLRPLAPRGGLARHYLKNKPRYRLTTGIFTNFQGVGSVDWLMRSRVIGRGAGSLLAVCCNDLHSNLGCLLKTLDHDSPEMVNLVQRVAKIWKYRRKLQQLSVFPHKSGLNHNAGCRCVDHKHRSTCDFSAELLHRA